ncbi:MAG: aconitate hydratase AcnA [Acidobacteriota bacterium]|nr:aconitate hydratase AcnA [Acidobacteriota bacterium]
MKHPDHFSARSVLKAGGKEGVVYRLDVLEKKGVAGVSRLPFSIKVLLESLLRNEDGKLITKDHAAALAAWKGSNPGGHEVPFKPARVILQDFTGVPAIVDLAAMRAEMKRRGGDPARINPLVPVDLVIDHSVQVDVSGSPFAILRNADIEFERNRERYEFLRWGQKAFRNFRVVPPSTGIVHQVNLEFLAKVVIARNVEGELQFFPDTLVGTDSHTTMVNGLGVLGWGVGGIEAEAAMLGQPYYMLPPAVVGVKLEGQLREGVTATDLVLRITEMLRKKGVVEKFVEFYGSGLSQMALPDRATVGNMAPEYGATMGFFPVDDETLRYLRMSGRTAEEVDLVERYSKEQGIFRTDLTPDPEFSETVQLDLGTIEPALAGPKRPQDRVLLPAMKESFRKTLTQPVKEGGFGIAAETLPRSVPVAFNGDAESMRDGSVVIAAITSCTNTSNPSVMIAAGLLAKKAAARGLKPPRYVKTSLAPGSKVVTEYLKAAGLLESLDNLGFNLVGYGCTTCIGNSGPLAENVARAVTESQIVAAAVLSGNRNFEGRIHPQVKANFLASPPLVVAFAIAGTVEIDLSSEPLGSDRSGQPVFLREIWPSQKEIANAMEESINPEMFRRTYSNVWDGNASWNGIPVKGEELYAWRPESTYIQEPPYFTDRSLKPLSAIKRARVLVYVGDSVTTDHISPAGNIAADSPAGLFLTEHGVGRKDFNSYGSRRGNDRVMVRGTFANIRLKNQLVPGIEGGVTLHFPSEERMSIYDAAMRYKEEGVPLVVIAGREYGAGSSRDWAAKGVLLLGVKAVLAASYERIHRSNLIGMGVLPLEFKPGEGAVELGLSGHELIDIPDLTNLHPRQDVDVSATSPDGKKTSFRMTARLDSPVEVDYYRSGGILDAVLKGLAHKTQ